MFRLTAPLSPVHASATSGRSAKAGAKFGRYPQERRCRSYHSATSPVAEDSSGASMNMCRSLAPRRAAVTSIEALQAWGDYDRDDPFPLFAAVRERGPVHRVTLADGHDAWLVVGYDEARKALNDTRLSKD